MKSEENILDAADYILMALNNIKNYKEFIEYKEELIKAILDIKNLITNLIKNKFRDLEKNDNQENQTNSRNESYLSTMLGLKFNYDNYFNENEIRNLTQNEEIIQNNRINNQNYIKNNNNKLYNNISYNKSLRNKFKAHDNTNYKSNKNTDQIYQTYNSVSPREKRNKKQKLRLIADIVMKINNEEYIYEILTKLFGDNLTDKLMSSDVSDEFLEAIQNSINEIESIKKRDDLKTNNEEIGEKPRKYPFEKLINSKIRPDAKRSLSSKKINNIKKKNNKIYKEFNYVKSLRKNETNNNFKVINKKYIKKEKPFINATNPYGNYFDAPLQNGGLSKLNSKIKY